MMERKRILITKDSQDNARPEVIACLQSATRRIEKGANVSIVLASLEIEIGRIKTKYFRHA